MTLEVKRSGQGQPQLIETFLYSIKSKETQKTYLRYLRYFKEFHGKSVDKLLSLDKKVIEEIIIRYIMSMRDKELSYSSIKGRIAPITSFLTLNDIVVNNKKLKMFAGEKKKTVKDKAYSHSDLTRMFQIASFRVKVIISIYSSTGIRKEALIDLKLKHLEHVEFENQKLYKFTAYETSGDEYITYCTPECASYIDEYIEQRKKAGEHITDESYLVRNDFNFAFTKQVKNPKPATISGLNTLMNLLLQKTGIRQVNHKTENSRYKRHEKAVFNAFRKYFDTCLANCDINVTIKEMLMGHSVGLDDCYYKPTENQLLTEYLKAVNELTINEENRLRTRVEKLEIEKNHYDALAAEIEAIKRKIKLDSTY